MTQAPPSLGQTARRLLASLRRETAVARLGAVADVSAAAAAKRAAFTDFATACAARDPQVPARAGEREALRQLLFAANENALVLDAVRQAVEDLPRRLRAAVLAVVDPGTYTLHGSGARHVLATRVNASA